MIADILGRPLRNLRLSVTDRCNLRCQYCMPEEEYVWLPQSHVLSFESDSVQQRRVLLRREDRRHARRDAERLRHFRRHAMRRVRLVCRHLNRELAMWR